MSDSFESYHTCMLGDVSKNWADKVAMKLTAAMVKKPIQRKLNDRDEVIALYCFLNL